MDAEELKREVEAGRIGIDRLIDVIAMQQRKIAELERKLGGAETTAKLAEAFSLRAEEKRQKARGKKQRKHQRPMRRGRVTSAEKIQQAERTEQVFSGGSRGK